MLDSVRVETGLSNYRQGAMQASAVVFSYAGSILSAVRPRCYEDETANWQLPFELLLNSR